jgi:hypothetical protein
MRIMHLSRELETGNRLLQMGLQRADHDEHERLGVAAKGVLKEVSELQSLSALTICMVQSNLPLSFCRVYETPLWQIPEH